MPVSFVRRFVYDPERQRWWVTDVLFMVAVGITNWFFFFRKDVVAGLLTGAFVLTVGEVLYYLLIRRKRNRELAK